MVETPYVPGVSFFFIYNNRNTESDRDVAFRMVESMKPEKL